MRAQEVSYTYLPGKPTNKWLKDGFWSLSRSFPSRERVKGTSNRENSLWNNFSHKRLLAYDQSTGFVRRCERRHALFLSHTHTPTHKHTHLCGPSHCVKCCPCGEIISPQILSCLAPLILYLSPQTAVPQRGLPWALANPILSHCLFAGFYFLLSTCVMYMMYLIYILFVSSN